MTVRNILFIMCDQLRYDYLSCYGHPHLHTPHIDALAARGVRFSRATVQSPICGPSRMCTYTGRYMSSHGAYWNSDPLSVSEHTFGDYLRPLGRRTAVVGKLHHKADTAQTDALNAQPPAIVSSIYSRSPGASLHANATRSASCLPSNSLHRPSRGLSASDLSSTHLWRVIATVIGVTSCQSAISLSIFPASFHINVWTRRIARAL